MRHGLAPGARNQWRSLLLGAVFSLAPTCAMAALSHAWALRYVSVDSIVSAVGTEESDEALCLLGFAKAMAADYEGAEQAYGRVLQRARSALPRMEAQVGMMRVCQRRGENKRFYDFYAAAQESARRLQGAIGLMDEGEQRRWQTVQTDLHMLLCVYLYYQRQEEEAEGEYAWLETRMHLLEGDTAQLAYFYFLRGNRKGQESVEDLRQAAMLAEGVGAVYVWAKAMSSIIEASHRAGPSADEPAIEELSAARAVRAAFEQYGSPFDVSQTWLLEGRLWLDVDGDSALRCMEQALSLLPQGEICPEWRADVHEGLCMAYSALGMKTESDIHRNHYLDILDSTRQDHRMAQRLEALEAEERAVGRGLWMAAIGAVLLMAVLMWMVRRLRRRHAAHYAKELASLELAMQALRGRSDESASALSEYGEQVDAARREGERRAQQQQREWVDKLTCLSIVGAVMPLVNRMLHAIDRMEADSDDAPWQRNYIHELSERIIVLNDVLTRWIALRRGMVGLRIETFPLQPLMDIVGRSHGQFERAGIDLSVEPTDAWVKADRALTLFMLNTLLDNARKYTARGGSVRVSSAVAGEAVELSVEDTGGGGGGDSESHGFGLMNCKGIIEQYHKTSRRFALCSMGNEQLSTGGSRYWFRLPIAKALASLFALLFALPMQSQDWRTITDAPADGSLPAPTVYAEADSLLAMADSCAWLAYDANLAGYYEQALEAIDQASALILRHVGAAGERMTEIEWWQAGVRTDYHLILDLHNEAAIAALALRDWSTYAHHNEIYTRLYKLMAQDLTLEDYCSHTARRAADKRVLLLLISALALLALLVYYALYYRNHILMVFNMRQLLETCQRLTAEPSVERLADIIAEGIRAIRPTEGVALLTETDRPLFSQRCPMQDYMSHCLSRCLATGEPIAEGRLRTLPLSLEEKPGSSTEPPLQDAATGRIGAICIVLQQAPTDARQDRELNQLLALLAKHAATAIYYSSVRSEQLRTDIELREDERRRAETEAEALHVRNMIVDNALSALKHETMYYPTRIQQLASLSDSEPSQLRELATYYRDVFTTLSGCALDAIGKPLLRKQQVSATQMEQWMAQALERQGCPSGGTDTEKPGQMLADAGLLQYLADCLAQWVSATASEKTTTLTCTPSEKFVMFALTFPAPPWTESALREAFFPESLQAESNEEAQHHLLIAKQIIRLHDEHIRRGCRIGLTHDHHALTLTFTLPASHL